MGERLASLLTSAASLSLTYWLTIGALVGLTAVMLVCWLAGMGNAHDEECGRWNR